MQGVCNSTFAYPFNPYDQVASDIPTTRNLRTVFWNFCSDSPMEETNYNQSVSKVGGALVFVSLCVQNSHRRGHILSRSWRWLTSPPQIGSCLAVLGLVFGLVKFRLSFLIASITAGLSALTLMMYVSRLSLLFAFPLTSYSRAVCANKAQWRRHVDSYHR